MIKVINLKRYTAYPNTKYFPYILNRFTSNKIYCSGLAVMKEIGFDVGGCANAL